MSTVPLSSSYKAGSMTSSDQAASYKAKSDEKYTSSSLAPAPAQNTVLVDVTQFANVMRGQGQPFNPPRQGDRIAFPDSDSWPSVSWQTKMGGYVDSVVLPNLVLPNLESKGETIKFPNGDTYVGEVSDGKPHGKGVMKYYGSIFTSYTGAFVAGNRHGQGIMTLRNGDKYEGNWADDAAAGQGYYEKSGGSYETGIWKKGNLLTGQKVTMFIDQFGVKNTAVVEWKNGKKANPASGLCVIL